MRSPSSEADRLRWAHRVIERGRFNPTYRVKRALGPVCLALIRGHGQLALTFPVLGVWDALEERGAFDPGQFRHPPFHRRPWWKRVKYRALLRFSRWCMLRLGNRLYVKYPDRPGWNDYWMACWMITGNPQHVHEIYKRATEVPGPDCSESELATLRTARWMVTSVRAGMPDFEAAISALELHFGVPVVSLVPEAPRYVDQVPAGVCSRCMCEVGKRTLHNVYGSKGLEGSELCGCQCHSAELAPEGVRVRSDQ
jgi:hypothetical protein